jgi:DNA-binding NtrC family response regulator
MLLSAGRFREDLYHRLAGVTLTIPPLRERPEDFGPLFERFFAEASSFREGVKAAPGTTEALLKRPWRGNVRELRQAVRRALALGGTEISERDFLPSTCRPVDAAPLSSWLIGKRWKDIERSIIVETLARTGTIRAAAEALGIPKSTLADRVRALRISMCEAPRLRGHQSLSDAEATSVVGRR